MNKKVVDKWLDAYPQLKYLLCAGTISLKAVRVALNIDRDFAYQIYLDLLQAGAIKGCGATTFRATPALKEYVEELLNE